MLALVACSAAVYGWDASRTGYSDYYATAAKSMATSWKAFFFGAFDPQSTITLDKLSGFLVPQALSVRLFGFSAWSLALPQVLEGLITIVAAFFIIRRWAGPIGGLIGAVLMAATPLLVSMFSHPMEDGMLTMFSTLAVGAVQLSIDTRKRRYLMIAGVLVGLGFQAKMMQAWLPLPAMALVYLAVAAGPLIQKVRRLLAAAFVTLVVSFSWMTAIALVPASQRPYIDGTTDNNIFTMVLGYNGINRFVSNFAPGALTNDPISRGPNDAHPVGLVPAGLTHNPLKLFVPVYASQIGWLYPLAALGLVLGIFVIRKSRSEGAPHQGLSSAILLNGTLLLTLGGVMSVMNFPHTAYLASLAFPLAALGGIGLILAWRDPHVRRSKVRFALPIAVAIHTIWSLVLIAHYPQFAGWLLGVAAVLGGGLTLILFGRALGWHNLKRRMPIAAVLAVVMLAPLTWSLSTLDNPYGGTANDAYAGPPAPSVGRSLAQSQGGYGVGLDSNRATPSTDRIETKIYDYAKARSGSLPFVLATDTWRSAAPIIMHGGARVLPMGGYTSRVPAPSATGLRQLVAANSVHFVLLTGADSKSGVSTPNVFEIQHWVRSACRFVPASDYNPGASSNTTAPTVDSLYDCLP